MSKQEPSRLHRRTVLQASAGIAVVAGISAGCGTGERKREKGTKPVSETIAKSDVPVASAAITSNFVVTQPSEGTFEAYSNVCPHAGCKVSLVKQQSIVCQCHGSEFSVQDGSRTAGPSTAGLAAAKLTESGDQLTVSSS